MHGDGSLWTLATPCLTQDVNDPYFSDHEAMRFAMLETQPRISTYGGKLTRSYNLVERTQEAFAARGGLYLHLRALTDTRDGVFEYAASIANLAVRTAEKAKRPLEPMRSAAVIAHRDARLTKKGPDAKWHLEHDFHTSMLKELHHYNGAVMSFDTVTKADIGAGINLATGCRLPSQNAPPLQVSPPWIECHGDETELAKAEQAVLDQIKG